MKIIEFPNALLEQVSNPVDKIDDTIVTLVDEMFAAMRAAGGVGLAAIQVGVSLRIFVLDMGNDPRVFINPEIIGASAETIDVDEGCLSFPGIPGTVKRRERVIMRATNLDGIRQEFLFSGLSSAAAQHELDHLNGILFTDRISLQLSGGGLNLDLTRKCPIPGCVQPGTHYHAE